jgi:hypothetical protein
MDASVASDCRPQAFASRTAAERVQYGGWVPPEPLEISRLPVATRPPQPKASPLLPDAPRHRLRRGSLHPTPRRSQRRLTPFFHALLAGRGSVMSFRKPRRPICPGRRSSFPPTGCVPRLDSTEEEADPWLERRTGRLRWGRQEPHADEAGELGLKSKRITALSSRYGQATVIARAGQRRAGLRSKKNLLDPVPRRPNNLCPNTQQCRIGVSIHASRAAVFKRRESRRSRTL